MTTVQSLHATQSTVGSTVPECNKKYAKIQEGIESSISLDGKAKISRILCEIKHLSDVEKLLLYLKLPTGVPQDDHLRLTPPSCLHTANRKEQGEAFTWIRSHLEEHGDVCMPKAEVYDEYRQYCDNHELRPLCNADFGKMMKQVFPEINTRRLGQRGQSKYFYGGLRKKTDHAPPTLPELAIHTKSLEMDTSTLDNEIFKASCLLLCEWADKLLDPKDSKFASIQSIAEHLVTNLYVNTKSVAAFTLIAAMQENGSQNLKGSALFNSQPSTGGDRHKETNMLLQQKLQKNKLLQKQKEKLQAMKEEVEQQHGGQPVLTTDRKTPSTPSRKSATPSRLSKTPKLSSPSPSPVPLQSPAKLQSKQDPAPPTTQQAFIQPSSAVPTMHHSQTGSGKSQELPRMHQSLSQTVSSDAVDKTKGEVQQAGPEKRETQSFYLQSESAVSVFTFEEDAVRRVEKGSTENQAAEQFKTNTDVEMAESASPAGKGQEVVAEVETPFSEMEVNQGSGTHVRKINFDDIFEQQSVTDTGANVNAAAVNNRAVNKGTQDGGGETEKTVSESEKLSKSDGHVSLKMLLERKDGDKRHLNKSLGVIEKSKNTLFGNQSTVSGRSAFVPFSQVQNRKENSVNQSTGTSTGIPVFIPSSTMNQSTSVAMIAVPSSAVSVSQDTNQSVSRVPDSIIKILPSTAAFQFKHGSMDSVPQNVVIQSQSSATESNISESSISCLTKDTQTFITTSSVLSKSSSCDSIVSLSPSIASSSSSSVAKHARTRFTPIRPKASPNKAPPSKENKGDNPAYDKRPVSEILKEKRAKEQAEALAKLQVGMRLPTIPMQPSLTIGRTLATMPNTVSPKEVVIIVNNQAGGANVQTVMAPGMFVTQSLVPSDGQNQSIQGFNEGQYEGRLSMESVSIEQGMSEMEVRRVDTGEATSNTSSSAKKDNTEFYHDTMSIGTDVLLEKESEDISADVDKEQLDKVDLMWTETPAKIAKLNITSPYRPDSACSLGRDTPVKIMKASDSCSSRPESACSFGRETPSGARKRKSSDFAQRRDFKRLNSTGDEGEDVLSMKLHTDALSPEAEARISQNMRRTRSCTYELDKDTPRVPPSTVLLTAGLQSPDITSLEREALLESGFPHNTFGNLHKHKQSSSIGVSAKSLRHSQQKLIKNKPDLDQRVRNFLQKDENVCLPVQTVFGSSQRPSTSIDHLVMKDNVSEFKKASEFVGGGILRRSRFSAMNKRPDMEPSGLPSDVADWINDTIEKRQQLNTSVMSEPELSSLSQKTIVADLSVADFKFEVGQPVSQNNEGISSTTTSTLNRNSKQVEKSEESTFMVPKAPALHVRGKDINARMVGDFLGKSPRCQSLPTFSSPNQSPVPSVTSPVSRQGLFRATSMSPRTPQHDGMIGEVSSITSPVQRSDIRENHPLGLSIHAGSKFKEDLSVKQHTRHGSYEDGRSVQNQMGSYLASMQHTLQKPGDIPAEQHQKPREQVSESPLSNMTSPQSFAQVAASKSPFAREANVAVDRNLPQIQERYVSQTPFSDSGYHSNGTSPVQNATPISSLMDLEVANQQLNAKRSNDSADFMGVMPQQSPLQSPSQYPGIAASNPQSMSANVPPENLVTSANSAFVPIQGSSQDARYVTPIKPTVTLPNTTTLDNSSAYSSNIFVEPTPTELSEEAMIVSPQGHDPPSYETAIKSLRKTGNTSGMSNDNTGFQGTNTSVFKEPNESKVAPTETSFSNVSQPNNFTNVGQPTSFSTVSQPNSFSNVGQPTSFSTVSQPTSFSTVSQPTSFSSVSQPTSFSSVSQPTSFSNLGQTSSFSSVGQASSFSSVSQPSSFSSVSQPSSFSNVGQPSSFSNVGQETSFSNVGQETSFSNVGQETSFSNVGKQANPRVSLLANMGKAVESDGKQGLYGPFASKLVQLSRQTQQKPIVPQQQQNQHQQQLQHQQQQQQPQQQQQQQPQQQQLLSQQSVSSELTMGVKSPSQLIKQMSHGAVMSAGLETHQAMLKSPENPMAVDIPPNLVCDPNIGLGNRDPNIGLGNRDLNIGLGIRDPNIGLGNRDLNRIPGSTSVKLPISYGKPLSQSKLSSELMQSEGAIAPSVQFKNQMDLEFISPTHFLPSSNDHLIKTAPSLPVADHSIENISQPQSMFQQYAGISQNDTTSIENQVMLNFATDAPEQQALPDAQLDQFNITDEGIKCLSGPKDLCVSDNEFDINLTLETLKELDGQYLSGSNEMYGRDIESVQQLEDFPMFESP